MSESSTIRLARSGPDGSPGAGVSIPRQIQSVRLVRQIGRGAMGVVWLGSDEILGREVAVKFLVNAVASADDPSFQMFVEGARAAAAVRHPGLTEIYHAGVVEGVPFLVMEYVGGPVLSEVLRRSGSLGVGATLGVLEAVCAATAELHERGIVHRDIKPSNILLDPGGRIVMTDFGLACSRPLGAIRGGAPAGVSGTPHYMAPEMFDGVVSVRGDVYALGIMAFELITGDVPYTGSLDDVLRAHRLGTLPADPLARCNVAPPVVDVIARAAHKEPLYRYKTAGHLLRALREACPEPGVWSRARDAAIGLVASSAGVAIPPPKPADAPVSTRYYDYLQDKATKKRADLPATDPAPVGVELREAPEGAHPGTLVAFVPCVRCGYDLRGLPADGRCPECGSEIRASLDPDRLMFADAEWLAGWKRGFALLGVTWSRWWLVYVAWALLMMGVSVAAIWSAGFAGPMPSGLPAAERRAAALGSAARVSNLAVALMVLPVLPFMAYAGWLLTRAEPGRASRVPGMAPDRPTPPRWRTFLLGDARAVPAALPGLVSWLGASLSRSGRAASRRLSRAVTLGVVGMMALLFSVPAVTARQLGHPVLLSSFAVMIGVGVFCLHIGGVVERIPDRRLARRTCAAGAGTLLLAAAVLGVVLLPRTQFSTVRSWVSFAAILGGWAVVGYAGYAALAGARAIGRVLASAVPLQKAVSGPAEPPARPA